MSGAVPCTGSYRPSVPCPIDADGSMPIEPVSIAAASDRMSPKMLLVTMTSNCLGARISSIAAASTKRWVSSTSGYCAPTRVTTSRQSCITSSTLALSTEQSFLRRLRAQRKATWAMRSTSGSE